MGDSKVRKFLYQSNKIEGVMNTQALHDAIKAYDHLSEYDSLSHENVKETHEVLMENRQPDIAGQYRNCQVYIGKEMPPSHFQIKSMLDTLYEKMPDTAVDAIQLHVEFEKIHPFVDGNGRIGRIIYLWYCKDHLEIEPIVWHADHKEGYYDLFSTGQVPQKHI